VIEFPVDSSTANALDKMSAFSCVCRADPTKEVVAAAAKLDVLLLPKDDVVLASLIKLVLTLDSVEAA